MNIIGWKDRQIWGSGWSSELGKWNGSWKTVMRMAGGTIYPSFAMPSHIANTQWFEYGRDSLTNLFLVNQGPHLGPLPRFLGLHSAKRWFSRKQADLLVQPQSRKQDYLLTIVAKRKILFVWFMAMNDQVNPGFWLFSFLIITHIVTLNLQLCHLRSINDV